MPFRDYMYIMGCICTNYDNFLVHNKICTCMIMALKELIYTTHDVEWTNENSTLGQA